MIQRGTATAKTNYLNGITSNYGYDALYELTRVTQGTSTTESYSYDAVGSRLSSSGVPTYSYNASNELTSNSLGSYTYDANGNTLSDAQGHSYTWDFENRLTQAVVPGATGGTTTFKYDPFGRRIQKSGPLGTTNYLYDGLEEGTNVIEEVDDNGNMLARYTQGLETDEPLAEVRGATTSYYQQDGLGSVSSLSNSSATLANTYTYDSFGKQVASTGTLVNPFQYTARDSDTETGLYYYRARYYDQTAGRFASEDPIAFKGGINFYRYVSNSPVDSADPLGLYQTKGSFSSTQLAQLASAVAEAIATLNKNCPSCAGADGPKIANAISNATFVWKPNQKDCGFTGPLSVAGLRHEVGLGSSSFGPTCCSLASTITHEAVHLNKGGDDQAYGVEKSCFGCPDTRPGH